jgi:hypothetical protein
MRRASFSKHANDDPEKPAELRHRFILHCRAFATLASSDVRRAARGLRLPGLCTRDLGGFGVGDAGGAREVDSHAPGVKGGRR